MIPVRRLLGLTPARRRLVLEAAVLLGAIRLGLRLLPFPLLQRNVARLAKTEGARGPVGELRWALGVASRHMPRATCLAQALAGQVLLARHGCPPSFRLGVRKDARGRLRAHAWLEHRGGVLIGNRRDLSRFTPLGPPEVEGA
jgi:hypothetical protein